ncbi:MAG: hypothetical protein ACI9J3_000572 [Parvicellaceae bacterium]|jgi:hypothetical protein
MSFQINATEKTPEIDFSTTDGVLRLKGISIPEDSKEFYRGLYLEVEDYLKSPKETSIVEFHLEYFNTSTTLFLRDLMKKYREAHHAETTIVQIIWIYEEDDLDMEDAGLEFKDLFDDVPFDVKSVHEFDFR